VYRIVAKLADSALFCVTAAEKTLPLAVEFAIIEVGPPGPFCL
jgi:hypothetical protein